MGRKSHAYPRILQEDGCGTALADTDIPDLYSLCQGMMYVLRLS